MRQSCGVPKSQLAPSEVPVIGRPMPADGSCKIPPHSCEVWPSFFLQRYLQQFTSNFFKYIGKPSQTYRICLVQDVMCISLSSPNEIMHVIDLTKESPHFNGCDLTVRDLVVVLPENKLSEWQTMSGAASYRCFVINASHLCH